MSSEHPPLDSFEHDIKPLELLSLPDRQNLINGLDTQFNKWVLRTTTHHPTILQSPMANLIVRDCHLVPDVDEVLNRDDITLLSLSDRFELRERLKRLQLIAAQAHNSSLDDIQPLDDEQTMHFDDAFQWIKDEGRGMEIHTALTYLRRLYVAREQLAVLNGLNSFDNSLLKIVLARVVDDERRLHPINPL